MIHHSAVKALANQQRVQLQHNNKNILHRRKMDSNCLVFNPYTTWMLICYCFTGRNVRHQHQPKKRYETRRVFIITSVRINTNALAIYSLQLQQMPITASAPNRVQLSLRLSRSRQMRSSTIHKQHQLKPNPKLRGISTRTIGHIRTMPRHHPHHRLQYRNRQLQQVKMKHYRT